MVFLPLSDEDPLERDARGPVTLAIILANLAIFVWQVASGPVVDATFSNVWGVVPDVARGDVPNVDAFHRFAPFISYMFLHGGVLHFLGNMLFLWIFGDNVEDATSRLRFLLLYFVSGIVGALFYVAMATDRAEPLIGASGAIAGVLGAYLMIRPCAIIRVLFIVMIFRVRAVYVIAVWMGLQLWNALTATDTNVAWWAHVGGALAGAALVTVLRGPGVRLFACTVDGGKTIVVPGTPAR